MIADAKTKKNVAVSIKLYYSYSYHHVSLIIMGGKSWFLTDGLMTSKNTSTYSRHCEEYRITFQIENLLSSLGPAMDKSHRITPQALAKR
jgi:hypothetical protein